VDLADLAPGWVRIETAAPAPGLRWRYARGVMPGHFASRSLSPTRLRDLHASFAYRATPAQDAFAPAEVLSGVTRPTTSTATWRSDPGAGLPQWLELAWEDAQPIERVEVTFPGSLLRDVHSTPPFYVEPQTARDYVIEVEGVEAVRVEGNTQWRRVHRLETAAKARSIRLIVLATNGDPAASIAEIRCY